ncbi:MAG TPA: lysylphosphatidylglycerol synthase transmembrane domain-containing protein [Candidatus Aminicenantes bacterium]|nr:lysylphosphatidylglycerol synthase transmembrane domain-containing protein [Candidatus Aminicenantes bacterium]
MKSWKSLVVAAITLLLLFLFFRNVDLRATLTVLESIPWWLPLVYALSIVGQYVIRAWRWRVLLRAQKEGIAFRSLFSATVIGFMISYLLPGRIGEVVRPLLLADREGISRSASLGSIVMERLFDLLAVFLLFLVAIFFFPLPATAPLVTMRKLVLIILPLIVLFFALLVALNGPRGAALLERASAILGRCLPERFRAKGIGIFRQFLGGMHAGLGWRRLLVILGYSLGLWTFSVLFFWILMRGFADPTLRTVTLAGTFAYFGIQFVAAAVPTPGMAGSFDVASRYTLTVLLGVTEGTAVAYTLLVHFLILAVPVSLGLWALGRQGLTLKGMRQLGRSK